MFYKEKQEINDGKNIQTCINLKDLYLLSFNLSFKIFDIL
jgi:hypothetical protein